MSARIVLVGPPCSGKTTLGDELARVIKLPHIVTSKVLAQAAPADAEPLDHSLQLAHIVSRLRCADCANGFILDNFPRTAGQARDLQLALNDDLQHRGGITHVIDLEVPPSELERRAASRLVDPTTSLPVLHDAADSQAEIAPDDAIVDGQFVMDDELASAECMPDKQLVELGGMPSAEGMPVRRYDDAPDRLYQKLLRYMENITDIRGFYENEPDALSKTIDGSQAREEVEKQALEFLGKGPDGGAAAVPPTEEAPQRYAKARDLIMSVEGRNSLLKNHHLPIVRQNIGDSKNWESGTSCASCGCEDWYRRYVGPSPGFLLKECQDSANEVAQIRDCLWQFRRDYHREIHGDKRWYRCAIPSLLTACAKAAQEIEEMQQLCKDVDMETRRLHDQCTQACGSTATRAGSTYVCIEHRPDVRRGRS